MVIEDLEETEVKLDYFGGTSGSYAGVDRFNRIVDEDKGTRVISTKDPRPLIHCQMGLQQLGDRHCRVVELLAKGFTINEIASQTGLTYRQAQYAVQQGIERLRRLMAA